MPQGWRGLDREAIWGKSRADGWIDGHGTFSLTPHRRPMVGIFQWMPNASHEATQMEQEIITDEGSVKKIVNVTWPMDVTTVPCVKG